MKEIEIKNKKYCEKMKLIKNMEKLKKNIKIKKVDDIEKGKILN